VRVCWFWVPSVTKGRVCRLQFLLVLASAVISWFESHRTRGHILLSQIRDFPFRRLLRLAGSRWWSSTTPPNGMTHVSWVESYVTTDGQPAWNKAPIWGLWPDLDYCLTVAGLLIWGTFSDERTGVPFFKCYWSSPAQSFLGPSPVGLVAIFYCLDSSLKITVLWGCLSLVVSLIYSTFGRSRRHLAKGFSFRYNGSIPKVKVKVKVKVMLRPTVSRPVCLVTKHPFGA
jgi:hypothetical protein